MNDLDPLPSPERPKHETTDANAKYLAWSAIGLAVALALVLVLMRWTFWRFETIAERTDAAPSAVPGNQTPPAPRLQTNPSTALQKLQDREQQILTHYAWIDKPKSIVRIPIDQAIQVLAERGFPEPEGPVTEKPKP